MNNWGSWWPALQMTSAAFATEETNSQQSCCGTLADFTSFYPTWVYVWWHQPPEFHPEPSFFLYPPELENHNCSPDYCSCVSVQHQPRTTSVGPPELTPITMCALGVSLSSYVFTHHQPDTCHWPPLNVYIQRRLWCHGSTCQQHGCPQLSSPYCLT